MRREHKFRQLVAILWSIFIVALANAQDQTPLRPLEPSDTSSPAATLNSLIDSCNDLQALIQAGAMSEEREAEILPTAKRILDCLDLSELPKDLRDTAGMESALFLKEVLDRIELPSNDEIPQPTADESSDEGKSLQRWQIPNTRITIARNELGAYLFTPETGRNAGQYYRIVKGLPYRTDGPTTSPGLYDAYVAATKKKPTITTDTSSPRGTLTRFLDACDKLAEEVGKDAYLDRSNPKFDELGQTIISCLDSSQLPKASREYFDAEAAVSLKEILDRVPLPNAEEIPGVESLESGDGTEALTRWQVPRTQIVISKMTEGSRRGEFLFSAETVARAPEMYSKIKSQPYRKEGRPVSEGIYDWWLSRPGNPTIAKYVDQAPDWVQDRYFGMAIWQWFSLLIITPITLAIVVLVFRTGNKSDESNQSLLWQWLGLVFPVFGILIPLGFNHVVFYYLTLRGNALYVTSLLANIVFLMGLMVLIVRLSSRIAETIVALPGIAPSGLDASLIRIICRVLGIAAAVVILLEGGRYLGFPLTTLIASAGIGGLAIALSAQGLIKGLFGTVTILLDRPYRVGDRINVKEHDGFVEEIGLRSTKIRALDNRLISIPNDLMSEAEIQNIGKGGRIRRIANLQIPLDTPREQIEKALAGIREVLKDHEGMLPDSPPRVFFNDFNADSFNIRVIYWFSPADRIKFNEFAEKVNLEIMRTFEEQGIQFSLPFRHSYWKTDDQQGPLEVVITDSRGPAES